MLHRTITYDVLGTSDNQLSASFIYWKALIYIREENASTVFNLSENKEAAFFLERGEK